MMRGNTIIRGGKWFFLLWSTLGLVSLSGTAWPKDAPSLTGPDVVMRHAGASGIKDPPRRQRAPGFWAPALFSDQAQIKPTRAPAETRTGPVAETEPDEAASFAAGLVRIPLSGAVNPGTHLNIVGNRLKLSFKIKSHAVKTVAAPLPPMPDELAAVRKAAAAR